MGGLGKKLKENISTKRFLSNLRSPLKLYGCYMKLPFTGYTSI